MTPDMANTQRVLDRNPPFVQETKAHMAAKRELMRKNSRAAMVLSYLVQEMDETNAICVSYKVLEEVLGLSRQVLLRAIKVLAEDRWLRIVKVGSLNSYHVNSNPHWSGSFGDRQYAKFTATVVASSSEQASEEDASKVVELRSVVTGPQLVKLSPAEQRHLEAVG